MWLALKRRWRLWLLLAVLGVGALGYLPGVEQTFLALFDDSVPARARYQAVNRGMSPGEVRAVLGASDVERGKRRPAPPWDGWDYWGGQTYQIAIHFDAGGQVDNKSFQVRSPGPSSAQQLKAWLRRALARLGL